ncbi:MAG TPA: phosphoribosyltransferase [Planctomycetota bacterium]|nr:phosphoribosyltransferase [Planctomycetota bacterium]
MLFHDRREAGRELARRLTRYAGRPDVLVLALPRGGVPVGYEVARALHVPLDVFVVRKLGVPGQPELAMGAIASGGAMVIDPAIVEQLHLPEAVLQSVIATEHGELVRREQAYRGSRPAPDVKGRTVIVVDDGLATGASLRVALLALRRLGPSRIVAAVPVGPPETCDAMGRYADEIVCAAEPQPFHAVGRWYEDFTETTDEEVRELLREAIPSASSST